MVNGGPMDMSSLALQGCACMSLEWFLLAPLAVATEKSQVRNQRYENVSDPGPSGGAIRLYLHVAG